MTVMISPICLDARVRSPMDATAAETTSCPLSAASREPSASWLACRALSAFCFTVTVISSREAAVSSREEAWAWAPSDRRCAAAVSCTEADATSPEPSLTRRIMSWSIPAKALTDCASCQICPRLRTSIRAVRSPSARSLWTWTVSATAPITPRRRAIATGTMATRKTPVEARSMTTPPPHRTSTGGTTDASMARLIISTSFARMVNCPLQSKGIMAVAPLSCRRRSARRLDNRSSLTPRLGIEGGEGRASQHHQSWHVQDQRDPAVPQDGGRGDPLEPPEVGLQTLDHDLLLIQKLVDQKAEPLSLVLDDDHESVDFILAPRAHAEKPGEPQDRDDLRSPRDDLPTPRPPPNPLVPGLDGLDDGGQREDVRLTADSPRLPFEDGEGERQLEAKGRAAPSLALEI